MWQKTVAAALVLCGAQGFGYALCQEMKCMLYHDTEQKQMLLYMTREISESKVTLTLDFEISSIRVTIIVLYLRHF